MLALPAIARTAGFLLVAGAIVAATAHFRDPPSHVIPRRAESNAAPDRLAEELKRCRGLAAQAKDDAACETAWAESRRRFFADQPARKAAASRDASPKLSGR
jgi:conjugative transfer region protein TrbK